MHFLGGFPVIAAKIAGNSGVEVGHGRDSNKLLRAPRKDQSMGTGLIPRCRISPVPVHDTPIHATRFRIEFSIGHESFGK
jgi:hypothetical protein